MGLGKLKQGRALPLILAAILVVAGLVLAWHFRFGLGHLKHALAVLRIYKERSPILCAAVFFAAYVLVCALCIPVEVVLTLAGGALFGMVEGTLLVSFAQSVGATLALLGSRFLLRDILQRRFARQLEKINSEMDRDGAYYLLTLRLLPVLPYSLTNVLFGLTSYPVRSFYLITQVGTFIAVVLYVNAGTQIGKVDKLSGILSPGLIGALFMLGIVPWVAKALIDTWRRSRLKPPYA